MRYSLFLFFILIFPGCKKTNNGTDLPLPSTAALGYFIAKIDGKLINAEVTSTSIYDTVQQGVTYSMADSLFFDSGNNTQVLEFLEGAGINWSRKMSVPSALYINFFRDTSAQNDLFAHRNVIGSGKYPFGHHNHIQVPGRIPESVEIIYSDTNGLLWSSSNGDQTSSSFEITEINQGANPTYAQTLFKATFNCRLYDLSTPAKYVTVQRANFMGGVVPK